MGQIEREFQPRQIIKFAQPITVLAGQTLRTPTHIPGKDGMEVTIDLKPDGSFVILEEKPLVH